VSGEGGSERVDGVAVAAHAVAAAGDREDAGVVQQAVKDRGRDGRVLEDVAQSAMPRLVVKTMEPCS
jgi:hypothetical protein